MLLKHMVVRRDKSNSMIARHSHLAVCLLIGCFCIALTSKSSDVDLPIWKREILRSVGPVKWSKEELWDNNRAGLVFLNDHELLAYGVYHENKGFSSRTGPALTNPFILHAWLVNSQSGDIEDQKEWGTHAHDSAVHATSDGVLVKTGGIVKVYSRDFKQARDLPLPLDASSRIAVNVSSSGKTIMINQRAFSLGKAFHDRLDVFDAQSLSRRYSWDQSPSFRLSGDAYSISDNGIVAATSNGRNILYTQFGSSQWRLILDDQSRTCIAGFPTIVTNDLIAILCKELTVLTTKGEFYSIHRQIDSNNDAEMGTRSCQSVPFGIGNIVSSGAPVLAFTLPLFKEQKSFLRESELCLVGLQIVAFDLNLRKQVLKLNINPHPTEAYDFALSPDGSKLAVLADRTVYLYAIPNVPGENNASGAAN